LDTRLEERLLTWLKPVSRSFYLSIRFLPRRIRPTVATAYLLARASDTIADTNRLPADLRLETLRLFCDAVNRDVPRFFSSLRECARHQQPGGEQMLLDVLPRILEAVRELPAHHRNLVYEVLGKILRGQSLDLVRFEGKSGVHALQTEDELDEYTYLVAGCAGEFWTKLCLWEWPGYSTLSEPELVDLGIRFGKGLCGTAVVICP
jgi:farnesyl-diphosphate farnesyltransferase